ncbi:olfactory receptor 8B3 [Camelus ferus]|nr:olfactory receptor 8B3 [Camelus ferus]
MAYDRYVAICHPLMYNISMSPKVCSSIMLGSHLLASSGAMALPGCMLRLAFCDASTINHYFCDIFPLLQLSCTSTYTPELVASIIAGIDVTVPSITILVTYGFILSNILHISSRSKAFSTCSSHITAVSLFFGAIAFMYLKPSSSVSMDEGKISSVFYTNMVPLLNPLIYSLRNKDGFSQSNFNIFVPQTVDEGVNHGNHIRVEDRRDFPLIHRPSRRWFKIHKCTRSKEQKNNNYVGAAGTEGFGPALPGTYAEDAGQDETIRDRDGETGKNYVDASHNENRQLTDIGACAGELE